MDINSLSEIAFNLELGLRVFVHTGTGDLLFFPDELCHLPADMDQWEGEFKKWKKHRKDYFEVKKWTSSQAFEWMLDFSEFEINDLQVRPQLLLALGRPKPFQRFRYVIENSGPYRQRWYAYKDRRQIEFVAGQLEKIDIRRPSEPGS